jgi:iron complex outermembrane receptor protein
MSARFRRSFAILVLIVTGAVAAPAAFAETTYSFNLPEQALADSLRAIGQQTDMNILFEPDAVKNARSPALRGQYTVDEAIRLVLIGTKLEAQHTAASNVVIKVKSARTTVLPATSVEAPGNSGSRLAQSNSQSPQSQPATGPQNTDTSSATSEPSKKEGLSEIVVTGTLLHDVAPITPVMTLTQADLINQGYTTLADAIFDLPQNFQGAGTSPSSNAVNGAGGPGSTNNVTFASGINLRGLGGSATLVLLNGRRLAPTAFGGAVDISQIPVSVIDRVEIMTDGASALYGSDAVAGVVSIITKRDFSGVEVGGRATGISDGKTPNYASDVVGGSSWSSGGFVTSFSYEKDNPLFARNRSFSDTLPDPWALTPQDQAEHLYASVHQQLSDRANLAVDTLLTHRDYETQNNLLSLTTPFVGSGKVNQYSVSPQLDYAVSSGWIATLAVQWSKEADTYSATYPSPYTFADAGYDPLDYEVLSVQPKIDGRLFDMPGGAARLAAGAEWREERFNYTNYNGAPGTTPTVTPFEMSRHVASAYGELMIPIVGAGNAQWFAKELRFDLSGRYDHYTGFGGTTNPKVGLSWAPADDLKVHATYARSFQAPTLSELSTLNNYAIVAPSADPSSPTGSSLALLQSAFGSPTLGPETAKSFNFGLTYAPQAAPGLNLDASFFSIDFDNELVNLNQELLCYPNYYCTLQNEAALGSFFQRNPSLAQVGQILNNPAISITNYAAGNSMPGPYVPSDIKAIGNIGLVNAASTQIRGVDLTPRYRGAETPWGRFSTDLNASYYIKYEQRFTPGSPELPGDNIPYNPLRFRAKANVGWEKMGWAANARVNFANSYNSTADSTCTTNCRIASWTTVDLGLSYAAANAGWLSGARFAVTATNVLNRAPPFVIFYGYDPVNASPMLRTLAVTFTKRWGAEGSR